MQTKSGYFGTAQSDPGAADERRGWSLVIGHWPPKLVDVKSTEKSLRGEKKLRQVL